MGKPALSLEIDSEALRRAEPVSISLRGESVGGGELTGLKWITGHKSFMCSPLLGLLYPRGELLPGDEGDKTRGGEAATGAVYVSGENCQHNAPARV